ncbi:uncharacterized protein N7496_005021 [Penicillium cataractarum]|uniref:Uncharacterized protein n=1 Tax=Penicillium cataractarum TaxID=2100454 RepID=A0A9W9SGC9_9EURO|nr:uncharacterized protein N7496_005021 [Penicillium cataractarum]KAJ5377612.1 hypothetical protein N7496_005021 [Penicillium cataractarum]
MIWRVEQSLIVGLVLFTRTALATNCTTASVASESDAETLRQSCQVITGDLTIGPFAQNTSTINLNLDGITTVKGNIKHDFGSSEFWIEETPFTLTWSTLTKIGGSLVFGDDVCNMHNLTLPNLTTVGGSFSMGIWCSNLTYLDITSLEYVGDLEISGKNLKTLRHTKLSNATGLWIYDNLLDSVDSLFNNPLNITAGAEIETLPNVKNVTIGLRSVDRLNVYSNLTVILGGSSATEMSLGSVELADLTGLQRSSSLEKLTANNITVEPSGSMPEIYLPFDDLRLVYIKEGSYSDVVTLRLPPKAVNWTGGFELSVYESPGLNLSSMYGVDDQGNSVQTWYWPTNVSSVGIYNAIIANSFFDTFVAQQNGSMNATGDTPSTLSYFSLEATNRSHLDCTTFNNLQKMNRLPQTEATFASTTGYYCESRGLHWDWWGGESENLRVV